ncbi:MAG TPA: sigma-70 family RNA polymerase sigma factor [Gemmataceae bacterium]|jgi:RNA polymerase sigma-70 factor (ECF subfamily)|nr:sigma-70 family RNA polymerase sigma factor [Gemmataceae bacterium]
MQCSDAELLRAVAAGDREAFAAFYDRHAATVFGLLKKMLHEASDAEDVLQEIFLQVWRQAGRFDAERSSPLGWLVMMSRSRALDRLRRQPVPTTSELPEQPVLPEAEAAVELAECQCAITGALAQLPADQQLAIQMAYFGGLTYEQVAERLAIPVGTAKTRIRLGMMKLRKLLEPMEGLSA